MTVRPFLLEQATQLISGALSLAPLTLGSGLPEPAALLAHALLFSLALLAVRQLTGGQPASLPRDAR